MISFAAGLYFFLRAWRRGITAHLSNNLLTHSHIALTQSRAVVAWTVGWLNIFLLSGEQLGRTPLILSSWEPLVLWIMHSLGAPRQTSGHAPSAWCPDTGLTTPNANTEPPPLPPPLQTHPFMAWGGWGGGGTQGEWMWEIENTEKEDKEMGVHKKMTKEIYQWFTTFLKNQTCHIKHMKFTTHLTQCWAVFHFISRYIYRLS